MPAGAAATGARDRPAVASGGRSPDRRALATGFLNALRGSATRSPLVVAVDDVQWLDSSSGGILAFAARRLETEPVAFLLSRRLDRESALAGATARRSSDRLEHLCPAPLSMGALHRLLETRFGHAFSRPVVRRLREVSAGNPFFTLELARGLEGKRWSPGRRSSASTAGTLRDVVPHRLPSLPATERELLLAVAALPQPTLELLGKVRGGSVEASSMPERDPGAGGGARLGTSSLHPSAARLGRLCGRRRSEAQGASSAARRRRRRSEESARHLALAADGPDSGVAASSTRRRRQFAPVAHRIARRSS